MTDTKETYVTFMLSELERGNDRQKTLAKCAEKWQLTPRTFDRYWKVAKQRHSQLQQQVQQAIATRTIDLAVERHEKAVMSKETALQELASDFMELKGIIRGRIIQVHDQTGQVKEEMHVSITDEVKAKQMRINIVQKIAEMEGWNEAAIAPPTTVLQNNIQTNADGTGSSTTVVTRSITFKTRQTTIKPQTITEDEPTD